ncbi:unnamed protein product [Rhizophagus irregularis]|uniref:Uncharacterized protein n=1 Tax=Rhizophagus irregularis TaxID=588596 RepID=A0A915Z2C0_9GLOM|nr:unnamed protein product [Rhizophagus irregularis]CAB5358182.1 unnamed protein product [Rhizophagus irregularis]
MISTKKRLYALLQFSTEEHRVNQNETESITSSASSSSSNISFKVVTYDIWTRFKQIVDRIMTEEVLTLNEICSNILIVTGWVRSAHKQ